MSRRSFAHSSKSSSRLRSSEALAPSCLRAWLGRYGATPGQRMQYQARSPDCDAHPLPEWGKSRTFRSSWPPRRMRSSVEDPAGTTAGSGCTVPMRLGPRVARGEACVALLIHRQRRVVCGTTEANERRGFAASVEGEVGGWGLCISRLPIFLAVPCVCLCKCAHAWVVLGRLGEPQAAAGQGA